MFYSEFRVRNYKCFQDCTIDLGPGFNVVVGPNNSGKTSLLEASSLAIQSNPYLSLAVKPKNGSSVPTNPLLDVAFNISPAVLRQVAERHGHFIVLPSSTTTDQGICDIFNDYLISGEPFRVEVKNLRTIDKSAHSLGLYRGVAEIRNQGQNAIRALRLNWDGSQLTIHQSDNFGTNDNSLLAYRAFQLLLSGLYRFSAERFKVGRCKHGSSAFLKTDASNLAEVLSYIQGSSPAKFTYLNENINRVFPTIQQISVRPIGDDVEIVVWDNNTPLDRSDLAIPLNNCGSGVAQALAILYIALCSDYEKVIIVDEPSSFLHPQALRTLLSILRYRTKAQYIFSTHSPSLLHPPPSRLHCLTRSHGQIKVHSISSIEQLDLESLLGDLGVRFSDIFGLQNMVWVEGPTEEAVFARLQSHPKWHGQYISKFLAVKSTGELTGRRANVYSEVYLRLTRAGLPTPPSTCIILDREMRSAEEIERITRGSPIPVFFIKRRMVENYFLNASAIAIVISNELSSKVDASLIAPLLRLGERDVDKVNGAKLLSEVFTTASDSCLEYSKVRHGAMLVEWLLANKPSVLDELVESLSQAINRVGNETG